MKNPEDIWVDIRDGEMTHDEFMAWFAERPEIQAAARYRWLRESSAEQWEHPIVVTQQLLWGRMKYVGPLMGKSLDDAIDAARKAKS